MKVFVGCKMGYDPDAERSANEVAAQGAGKYWKTKPTRVARAEIKASISGREERRRKGRQYRLPASRRDD